MVKILPVFPVFFSIIITAFSQSIPFPENEAVWNESHTTIAGPVPLQHALCGDTLINGKWYSQLVALEVDSQLQVTGRHYLAGLRQENNIVYALFNNADSEILLYDFALQTGDEITLTPPLGLDDVVRKVDSTDVIMLAGKMRKVIYFANDDPNCGYPPEFWIEGIGSSYGVWMRALDPCSIFDAGGQLLCFGHGSEYLNLTLIECFLPTLTGCGFTNAVEDAVNVIPLFSVYPNPASNTISIKNMAKIDGTGWQCSVFSSLGEMMHAPINRAGEGCEMEVAHFPKGLYFIKIMDRENRQVGVGKFLKM